VTKTPTQERKKSGGGVLGYNLSPPPGDGSSAMWLFKKLLDHTPPPNLLPTPSSLAHGDPLALVHGLHGVHEAVQPDGLRLLFSPMGSGRGSGVPNGGGVQRRVQRGREGGGTGRGRGGRSLDGLQHRCARSGPPGGGVPHIAFDTEDILHSRLKIGVEYDPFGWSVFWVVGCFFFSC